MNIFIVVVASLLTIALVGAIAALAIALRTIRGFVKLWNRGASLVKAPHQSLRSLYDTGENAVKNTVESIFRMTARASSAADSVKNSADKTRRQSAGALSSLADLRKAAGAAGKYVDLAVKIFKIARQFGKSK